MLLGAIVNILQEKKPFYRLKKLAPFIVMSGSIAAAIVIIKDHNSSKMAQGDIDKLNGRLEIATSHGDSLLNELQSLRKIIDPFLQTAELRYPNLDSVEALNSLASELGKLQLKIDTIQQNYQTDKNQEHIMALQKFVPPKIDVGLKEAEKGRHAIYIKSNNLIPFDAHWFITTKEGSVLGAVMMGDERFFPTESKNQWNFLQEIDSLEVKDNYVKLEFAYRSIYYSEMGMPDSLIGRIKHEYRLVNNILQPWN